MKNIILDNVSKTYDNKTYAVEDFNLEIEDGEFIILVGPSGCGKSTTLRLIAGLESISEGELSIDGERANDLAPRERDLAMVFQDFALYPNMTVQKNLEYPLKMHRIKKNEREKRVLKASQMLGLEDLLDRKPGQLSGGQKQRVALGRAIVREPNAFLMDEPLSNLDAKLRVQMRYEISQLHRDLETTIIYVTHDQTEAMTMGDRIVVMNEGKIQQVGTPNQIYQQPANAFVAEFMGSPKINLFDGKVQNNMITWKQQQIPLHQQIDEEEVIIGVRPENLEIVDGAEYTVVLVENLGSEKYVYLENNDDRVVVLAENTKDYEMGEQKNLQISKPEIVNVFSKSTTQALSDPFTKERS